MNRTTIPNPCDSTKTIVRCQLNADDFKAWIGDTGIDNPPTGFRTFIRCTGNMLEYGLERIDGGAIPTPDKFTGKSMAELQQACAMKGIKYTKGDSEAVLLEKLKAKG